MSKLSRSIRLRFWWVVMDICTLGRGIPKDDGPRRWLFFLAVGKAYEAEGGWDGRELAASRPGTPR